MTCNRTGLRKRIAAGLLGLAALGTIDRYAAASDWISTSGGVFNVSSNWVGGVPGAAGEANFDLPNTYTVTFTNSPTNDRFLVPDGNVTFALFGQTYTTTGASHIGSGIPRTGRLTISNGTLAANQLILGNPVGGTGFLTVSSNAVLNASSSITVGQAGTGTLTVQNGGVLSGATNIFVGAGSSGLGTLTVTGADSTFSVANILNVGDAGIGSMTVSAGGSITSEQGIVGDNAGSEGTATVTGAGSRWVSDTFLTVGLLGRGELSVLAGGFVDSGVSDIALGAGSQGKVTVSGADSVWETSALTMGHSGTGALSVLSGGRVQSTALILGNLSAGSANVTVSGKGSAIDVTNFNTSIGLGGIGALSILEGGAFTTVGTTLGTSASGDGTLTVDGAGSSYTNTGNVLIGQTGKGSATVSNGGTLSTPGRIEIANNAASGFLSSLVVSGNRSTVNAPGGVFVSGSNAAAGGTGSLLVTDGGLLNAAGGTVKIWPVVMAQISLQGGTIHARSFERLGAFDFRDGLLHVDGGTFTAGAAPVGLGITGFVADDLPVLRLSNNAGSANITSLTVGNSTAGALEVLSGADLTHGAFATIGQAAGSVGSALVSGPGSTWTTPGTMAVGNAGSGTLEISNGAVVSTGPASIGQNPGGTGLVTVSGGIWSHGAGNIGSSGAGTLTIRNGGGVGTGGTATVGGSTTGVGTVNVTGANSQWTAPEMVLGHFGRAKLSVADGGLARSTNAGATLGNNSGGVAEVAIDGAGSRFEVFGELVIGLNGGASISVSNGAQLTSFSAALAKSSAGAGFVSVSGLGSVWTNNGSLGIGGTPTSFGGFASLTVEKGGTLNTGTAVTDQFVLRNDGALTLDGGTINARRFQKDGGADFNFHDGTFNVNGGQFQHPGPLTLDGVDNDDLPTLRLNGASTTSITELTVGASNRAALEVKSGGVLSTNNTAIGSLPGSNGRISVGGDGGNSVWSLVGNLTIGGAAAAGSPGGKGELELGPSGTVVVSGLLKLFPLGTVNLNGGSLVVGNFGEGGTFNFNAGTVDIGIPWDNAKLESVLDANHTLLPGRRITGNNLTLNGDIRLQGGALESPSTLVANSVLDIQSGSASAFSNFTIGPTGLLRIADAGIASTTVSIINNGFVQLTGDTATLQSNSVLNNGVLQGSGRITGGLQNSASGGVRASGADRLVFLGPAGLNAGRIEASTGGTVEFRQPLTNNSSGLITGRDGTLRFVGGLVNSGGMGFTSGIMDVFGDINNQAAGRITISGRGTTNFYDDVNNNGAIQVSTGSTAVYFGAVTGAGSFPGGGTNFFEGDLRPGASPAKVHFGGDLVLGPSSHTLLELAGAQAGSGHDQLDVAGRLSLGGTLEIALLDGFSPRYGESFDLLDFGSLTGQFDELRLPALPGRLVWDTTRLYSSGTVTAVPEPATLWLAALGMALLVFPSLQKRFSSSGIHGR